MCGIFGWNLKSGSVGKRQRLILATALSIHNDNRGGDSWGYYSPDEGVKRGMDLIVPACNDIARQTVVMAHTRKATTGAKTVQNAHPFEIGKILGAHNGMIHNHDSLNREHKRSFEVDSMHIFAHIDEGKDFGELRGYGSVQYINKDENKERILLCKMSNGDLAVFGVGTYENCTGVIWSSSEKHLEHAIAAAGIKTFPYRIDEEQVYSVEKEGIYLVKDTHLRLGRTFQHSYGDTPYSGRYGSSRGHKYHDYSNGWPSVWGDDDTAEEYIGNGEWRQSSLGLSSKTERMEEAGNVGEDSDMISISDDDIFPTAEEWEQMDGKMQEAILDSFDVDTRDMMLQFDEYKPKDDVRAYFRMRHFDLKARRIREEKEDKRRSLIEAAVSEWKEKNGKKTVIINGNAETLERKP